MGVGEAKWRRMSEACIATIEWFLYSGAWEAGHLHIIDDSLIQSTRKITGVLTYLDFEINRHSH